jgi:hypothetical protein
VDSKPADPRHGFYCPGCGTGTPVQDDGTCACCGADTCPFDHLEQQLGDVGLYVISAADKAVLDWAARLSVAELGLLRGDEYDQSEASIGFAQSELARREAKP